VGAITDSPNPRKYWSVLKTRLKKAGNELTTRCSQLKMTAADGKRYATDCFSQEDIIQLVRVIPSKKTEEFLNWFVYSDSTIDGQSKKLGLRQSLTTTNFGMGIFHGLHLQTTKQKMSMCLVDEEIYRRKVYIPVQQQYCRLTA
jgi:hypothetical protein